MRHSSNAARMLCDAVECPLPHCTNGKLYFACLPWVRVLDRVASGSGELTHQPSTPMSLAPMPCQLPRQVPRAALRRQIEAARKACWRTK